MERANKLKRTHMCEEITNAHISRVTVMAGLCACAIWAALFVDLRDRTEAQLVMDENDKRFTRSKGCARSL